MLCSRALATANLWMYGTTRVKQKLGNQLGKEIFSSLRKHPFTQFMVDYGSGSPKSFSRGVVLALVLELIKVLNQQKLGKRVGVVLPPGIAGFVANFSLLLSGRVPVNLNFTLGRNLNQHILESTNITTVLSASKVINKFPDFPWPKDIMLVDEILYTMANHPWQIFRTIVRSWLAPRWVLNKYQIPETNPDEIAVILFTSGSSGKPKGVPLSHRNILENCRQLFGLELFKHKPKVLVNLPLFHSFGLTVGMIFSTLRRLPLMCTPSPLDHKLNLKVIHREGVEILLGTPTFLRGYLRKAKKDELKSIKYVVAGAEKSPERFRYRWEKEAGCEYLEGYGLTETAPALSFNQPNEGKKSGSVGRLLPNIECKTIDLETGCETPSTEGGILCFRGENIFQGYWKNEEKSKEVLDANGWFKTGDLGRLDKDGFLWIDGRISRFSKIGGEMVPHEKIEEVMMNLLGICSGDELQLVISSRNCEQKGEELVVISTRDLDFQDIKEKLKMEGLPNLWIPRHWVKVDLIPILPTGKVNWGDIRAIFEKP